MELSSLLHLPVAYLLPFVVAITIIVFVHEYGHFKVARLCGVKVEAFSIGFGKEIFGWEDRQGTRWKVCWIPLGGYVRFEGDANATSMPADTPAGVARDPGNFHNKPVWQRAAVVAAGPIANFLLAIAIFTAAFASIGIPYAEPRVDEVMQGSAAEAAGIRPGDFIRKIDGAEVRNFSDLQEAVFMRAGEELAVVAERNGQLMEFKLVPKAQEMDDGFGGKVKVGLLGVKHNAQADGQNYQRLSLPEAFTAGVERTWSIVATTFKYLSKVFAGTESASQIGGPGTIAKVAGDTASTGFIAFISFVALLSVSIGLINLFPVPMLDGGHLVYYAIEALRGRPLGPQAQEWGFRIGFSFVVMLMLVGIWNDIARVVNSVAGG